MNTIYFTPITLDNSVDLEKRNDIVKVDGEYKKVNFLDNSLRHKLWDILESARLGKTNLSLLGKVTLNNAIGDVTDAATGYQILMDTLTYISKRISRAKYYKIALADYIPLIVGDGAYAESVITNKSYQNSSNFFQGKVSGSSSNNRKAAADTSISSVTTYHQKWEMSIEYSVWDVQQALLANNWSLIEDLLISVKTAFDLGLQQVLFLGDAGDSRFQGLLTSTDIPQNTTLITKSISSTTAEEFSALVAGLLAAYAANSNYTEVKPDVFLIPLSDYLGLQVPTSSSFPIVSKLKYLQDALVAATGNSNFRILPVAYANGGTDGSGNNFNPSGKSIYTLYRMDPESINMRLPVPFHTTQPWTNNVYFTQTALAQYAGVTVIRPQEILAFSF